MFQDTLMQLPREPLTTTIEPFTRSTPLELGSSIRNARASWTVMVYMSSDSLEEFALQDFLEMSAIGSTQNVNIVVQCDRTNGLSNAHSDWTDTRRGMIRRGDKPDAAWGTSIGEVNMGDVNTLGSFVNWGMSNYQADQYALVLWGHGSGFDVSIDENTRDGINARELNHVLQTAIDSVDLVGSDACLMGMMEFAYEVRNSASVFVGSQELEPGTGWDYTSILGDLVSSPMLSAAQFGADIVYRYAQTYQGSNNGVEETLSAIDLSALRHNSAGSLSNALSHFAQTVMDWATSYDLSRIDAYRDYFTGSFGLDNDPISSNYCDIGNFFGSIANDNYFSSSIRTAATWVAQSLNQAVISNFSASPGRSTGLSIYFSDRGVYPERTYNSNNLSFAANTRWDDLLNWQQW